MIKPTSNQIAKWPKCVRVPTCHRRHQRWLRASRVETTAGTQIHRYVILLCTAFRLPMEYYWLFVYVHNHYVHMCSCCISMTEIQWDYGNHLCYWERCPPPNIRPNWTFLNLYLQSRLSSNKTFPILGSCENILKTEARCVLTTAIFFKFRKGLCSSYNLSSEIIF